jgi:hypothetical protein
VDLDSTPPLYKLKKIKKVAPFASSAIPRGSLSAFIIFSRTKVDLKSKMIVFLVTEQ